MNEIELSEIVERMRSKSDNSYYDYISILRRDECLGPEIKMELGKFGDAELKAHCAAAEKLGRHRALHEASLMLQEFINSPCEVKETGAPLTNEEPKLILSVDEAKEFDDYINCERSLSDALDAKIEQFIKDK